MILKQKGREIINLEGSFKTINYDPPGGFECASIVDQDIKMVKTRSNIIRHCTHGIKRSKITPDRFSFFFLDRSWNCIFMLKNLSSERPWSIRFTPDRKNVKIVYFPIPSVALLQEL
ncbi:MAG: hypothetical protein RBG13Loki_4283 [Promethearchaeota archaeon CR_4]|nr:MAG: hypothetical protein RBG13Loki_4283 [Candidatus Lokiarchaeota archaeon CR_4]